MRMLHFIDTAGTDETFVPASAITMIQVTDNASVIVGFKSADPAVTANDQVDLTCNTGKSDEVALFLAQTMAPGNVGHGNVVTVKAGGTNAFADVTTVAYAVGS